MKPTLLIAGGLVAFFCSLPGHPTAPANAAPTLLRINRDDICVTNGVVSARPDRRLDIDTPSGVVRVATGQTAEVRFRYLGPSETSKPLASGELRRQIGLKLRAQERVTRCRASPGD